VICYKIKDLEKTTKEIKLYNLETIVNLKK